MFLSFRNFLVTTTYQILSLSSKKTRLSTFGDFLFIKLKEGVVLYELRQFSYVRQTIYKVIESSEKSIAAKLCLTGQQQYMSVLLQTKDTFKSVCVIQYVPIDMYTIHVISLSHDILCI